jgi:hypothetical protein
VIGAISGILIVPITTLYYDTGFLIGLKGFHRRDHRRARQLSPDRGRGAGGRIVEAFSSFYASNFKEVIVFTLDHSGSAAALAGGARGGRREGLIAMPQRLPIIVFALVMAAIPFIPGCRRSGSCCWTISVCRRWWRWGSCC